MKKIYILTELISECQVTVNETKILAVSEDKEKIEGLFIEKIRQHLIGTDITLEELKEVECYYTENSAEEFILGSDHFTHTNNEIYDYGSEMFWGYYIEESELI